MAAISAFSSLRCARSPAVAVITPSVSGNKPVICSLWTTSRKQTGLKAYPSLSICMSRGAKTRLKSSASDETEGQGYDKESGERKPVSVETSTATFTVEETPVEDDEPAEIKDLKRALIDSFYGTDRGLKASSETRAEIIELINQMEAKNPTPAPTDALNLLNGKWILVYTSFSELFPLLAAGTLPLVKVKEISQTFDSDTFTVENSVQFAGPLATTSFSTNATFEIRSPKRVQVKFDQGVIGTPQLTDSIEFPENVEFLGQKIDLNPMKGVLNSVQNAASSVAKNISHRPPFKFPIRAERAQSWLLTTYLDKDLRISRGDGSSVFVLIKEGSPLLPPS